MDKIRSCNIHARSHKWHMCPSPMNQEPRSLIIWDLEQRVTIPDIVSCHVGEIRILEIGIKCLPAASQFAEIHNALWEAGHANYCSVHLPPRPRRGGSQSRDGEAWAVLPGGFSVEQSIQDIENAIRSRLTGWWVGNIIVEETD